jgi:predicted phosphoribosyltransferase
VRIVPWIPPLFSDRAEGGRALARELELARCALDDPVIVGVARGGVAVAAVVARELAAVLTAVDVERVKAGGLRLGATTAQGPPYLTERDGVAADVVEQVLAQARRAAAALDRRLEAESVPLVDRTTVVVDDGVISGLTLAAACRWAQTKRAGRVIAAIPVGRVDGLARVREESDEIVCPHPLDRIAVVGQAYDSFEPLDEWYVAGLLADPEGGITGRG